MPLEPYRYNKRVAWNPRLGERFWGHAVLPGLSAVHVTAGGEWTACLPEVAECPWEEDDIGVPIDTDNTYVIRTRCGAHPDGGEIVHWVHVPRQLDPAYTPVGRCGRIVPLVADHFGDYPMLGVVDWDGFGFTPRPVRWRTPTGQYPPDLEDDGYLWVPMNYNRETLDVYDGGLSGPGFTEADDSGIVNGFAGPGCSVPYTAGPNLVRSWGYAQIGRHVGFRGGKMKLYTYSGQTCPLYSSGDMRVVVGWSDTVPEVDELPPTIVFDESYEFADLINIGSGGGYNWRYELDVDLPPMLIDVAEAEPKYWILFVGSCFADQAVNMSMFKLSPRHDIPPWFWSSTRNRISPGGILLP